jgi:hypothetical protein
VHLFRLGDEMMCEVWWCRMQVAQHAEVDSDLCHALHDALQVLRPLVGGQPQQSDTTDFMHTTDLHTLAQELRSHVNALPVAVQQLKAELQSSQAALAAAQSDLTNTTRHSRYATHCVDTCHLFLGSWQRICYLFCLQQLTHHACLCHVQ